MSTETSPRAGSTPPSAGLEGSSDTPAIRIDQVIKRFGDVTAVDGVSLDIANGEFFSLLGPSGSGKTTMLRMIAGFELPTDGRIELAGHDVTRTPPFERDVNTVFQDYALFPHMTVADNVAYGLRVKGVKKDERHRRVDEALARVQLAAFGKRKPTQLSGGQRQRVALARALVNRPKVLLLDEPLGALDLKLRQQMQLELKDMQRDVGITFVFVTHDQEEALTMSDRIAVFNNGRIEQVGAPRDLYEQPRTPFVASFVGTTNLVTGAAAAALFGTDGTWTIRPERIRVLRPDAEVQSDENTATGHVADLIYLGSHLRMRVALDNGAELDASIPNTGGSETTAHKDEHVGTPVRLVWKRDHARNVSP